jgi:hypothetical protein
VSCTDPSCELVTFWLAGSLGPAEAAAVASHVESCAECRAAALEGLSLVRGLRDLHLPAGDVVAAAAGEMSPPHLLVCARCRDEVALLRTVNADLGRTLDVPARPPSARRWQPIGLAALAAAAVLALVWIAPHHPPPPDLTTVRGTTLAAVDLLPVATQDGVPTLAWKPVASATRYRVEVFTDDGRPVWARETEAPRFAWPDDVARTSGPYRWRVDALRAGAVVARSRLAPLEIAP